MPLLRIRVTAAHIDAGVQCDPERCMAALAVSDATGRPVIVGDNVVIFPSLSYERQAPLPPEVCLKIQQFDDLGPGGLSPFFFDLDVPTEVLPFSRRNGCVPSRSKDMMNRAGRMELTESVGSHAGA